MAKIKKFFEHNSEFTSEPKLKVLEVYPKAWYSSKGYYGSTTTVVYNEGEVVGAGRDEEEAWEDALKRLNKKIEN